MTKIHPSLIDMAAVTLAALLCATPALADRDGKHGHGNRYDDDRYNDRQEERYDRRHERERHHDRYDRHERDRENATMRFAFGNPHREAINDYYGNEFRRGHCPPGLIRNGNGCIPPGQARRWHRGQPLPPHVHYHPLPRDLMMRLPPPPAGYDYVRVAGDILMIAVGTTLVVDAIQNIGR